MSSRGGSRRESRREGQGAGPMAERGPRKRAQAASLAATGGEVGHADRRGGAGAASQRAGDWNVTAELSSAMGLASAPEPSALAGGGQPVQRLARSAPAWAATSAAPPAPADQAAGETVAATASRGVAGASAALPHADQIQRAFGRHDVSGIRSEVGGEASEASRAIGAEAYAMGDRVAFSQVPDLHTAAHEAAHVVQQQHGASVPGGVGVAGDAHEQHADAVADAVVAGRSAEGLLDRYAAGSGGSSAALAVQRQDSPTATPVPPPQGQIDYARQQVQDADLSEATIREVQAFCGVPQTGVFDDATAIAVYHKQRELRITATAWPNETFCQRAGIIATNPVAPAIVSDPVLAAVMERFPDGVTVAIYTAYTPENANDNEFRVQAVPFAETQQAVGLEGGEAVLGVPCAITVLGDVIETVQSIHQGLRAKWLAGDPEGRAAAEAPAFTKVKNLSLFCHGVRTGLGLDGDPDLDANDEVFHDVYNEGLHNEDNAGPSGTNPGNVEAFVRGLSDAVVPSVRVQLFACYAGADADRSESTEWYDHAEGDLAGEGSVASALALELGPDATVSAHTTKGHTTENYAARVFGAEGGGGANGITLFESMYPSDYVTAQVEALFGEDAGAEARTRVRDQMWAHLIDAVDGERQRAAGGDVGRFATPMGQECFVNPDHARRLLHADWESYWVPLYREEMVGTAS